MKTLHISIIIGLIVSGFIPLLLTQNSFAMSESHYLRFDHLCCLPVLHPGQTITFSIDVHNPNNVSFYAVRPIIEIQSPESIQHLSMKTDSLDVLKPKSIGLVHVKIISDSQLPLKDITLVTSFTAKSNTSIIKVVDYSDESILNVQSSNILPPLKQLQLETPISYIECADYTYLLVIKRENMPHPVCVSISSIPRLIHQGWVELRTYVDPAIPPIIPLSDSQTKVDKSLDKNFTLIKNGQICDIIRTNCPQQQLTVERGSGIGTLSPQGKSDQTIRYAIKVEPFIKDYPLIVKVTNSYNLTTKTYVLPAENSTSGIFYFDASINGQVTEEIPHINFVYNEQRAESMMLQFLPP